MGKTEARLAKVLAELEEKTSTNMEETERLNKVGSWLYRGAWPLYPYYIACEVLTFLFYTRKAKQLSAYC